MTVTYAVTGTLTLGPRLLNEEPPATGAGRLGTMTTWGWEGSQEIGEH